MLTSPLVVASAEGARIRDVDGNEYIDFAGGVGALNGGHTPPAVVVAIREQLEAHLHVGYSAAQYDGYSQVCKRLVACHPGEGPYKALLVGSGAEAVENAVRIARVATGRSAVIAFDRAFHGRTLLTAALTDRPGAFPVPDTHRAMAPYPYRGVSAEDALASVRSLLAREVDPADVAAVVFEPVQGEGGFLPAPPEFLLGLREICTEHGIALVFDEIQSGMCRTGPPAACAHVPGAVPDLIAWGKSLGGGLPLAGVTGRAELVDAVPPGGIASGTMGGNPLSCAAARVTLDQVLDPAFQRAAADLGADLRSRLDELAAEIPLIGEVRGLGAMQAIELVTDRDTREPAPKATAAVVEAARGAGLLVKSCGAHGNVIRVLVPLVATTTDLDLGFGILRHALREAA
ncbi:4-aminobutyrate aminotransferase [Actinokineospora baliensis]|uniref:aspartate aminotransferase family protein n=1 Tax=Actinokineospora baliensis TaxID=547056 RepID=UPI00195D68D9|nr:aspartate aminotransferase family protein [Actinokineospora baliensis]MBM7773213.1 4-aminobutyrate aminotransferase [Actinokineospora baliensis]